MSDARATVVAHLDAFNAHDTGRLLALFTDEASWSTGQDVLHGRPSIAELFDDGLWTMNPSLTTLSMIVDSDSVAVELLERITVDGTHREFTIAAFFGIRDGLIHTAKIYREGTADIE